MKVEEVMRTLTGRHIGYMPQTMWEHCNKPLCWDLSQPLQKIPGKLTAYFKRELILEARKAKTNEPAGLYYLFLTDGSYLEVEY